jgi:hypothetical protein
MRPIGQVLSLTALCIAQSLSVAQADLAVTPIAPAPGSTVARETRSSLIVQTAPSALCSVTIELPGGRHSMLTATRANIDGRASWSTYYVDPGDRTATATCSLGGQKATATWRYSVP